MIPVLDEILLKSSSLLGLTHRVGDFVIVNNGKTLKVDLISIDGPLSKDLLRAFGDLTGDVVVVDEDIDANLENIKSEPLLDSKLRQELMAIIGDKLGIEKGSKVEFKVIESSGD